MKPAFQTNDIYLLAERVKNSDEKSFNKLFDLLWEPLFTFAQSLIMDEEKSKDIVQDVWIDYWNRRTKIENTNIKAYLFKAVKLRIYNHFRDNNFTTTQLDVIENLPSLSEIDENHDLENLQQIIASEINKLPERCKEIFSLSKLQGFDNEEIATKLGISKRSVENQLSQALKVVRPALQKVISIAFVTILFTFRWSILRNC